MKEATGEGSMTIVTIGMIAVAVAAAALGVGIMGSKAKQGANDADAAYNCSQDTNGNINCTKKTS